MFSRSCSRFFLEVSIDYFFSSVNLFKQLMLLVTVSRSITVSFHSLNQDDRYVTTLFFPLSRGSFKILDTVTCKELNDGFIAHPPSKVRRKVYEFSKAMPQVLLFTMIPLHNVWTDIFQDYCPGEDDIGLYFFSSNSQRSVFFYLTWVVKFSFVRSCLR